MINIRNIELNDCKCIAKIHLQSFSGFFLSSLGEGFLEVYYQAVTRDTEGIAICAVNEEDKIIGFSVGTASSKGFNKRLIMNNKLKFGLQGFKLLFTRPKSIYRLISNLNKKDLKTDTIDDGLYAELLSIAVLPMNSEKGIGHELLKEFENKVQDHKTEIITLTTDFYNNENVTRFYKNNGYSIFYEFYTYPNRRMYKLIKKL